MTRCLLFLALSLLPSWGGDLTFDEYPEGDTTMSAPTSISDFTISIRTGFFDTGDLIFTRGKDASFELANFTDPAYTGSPALRMTGRALDIAFFVGHEQGKRFRLNSLVVGESGYEAFPLSFQIRGYLGSQEISSWNFVTDGVAGTETLITNEPDYCDYYTISAQSTAVLLDELNFDVDASDAVIPPTVGFHYFYEGGAAVDLELRGLVLGRTYEVQKSNGFVGWSSAGEFVAYKPAYFPYVDLDPEDASGFFRLSWDSPTLAGE